jgi:transcriptional regulator with XRE-family HTH domain
MAQDFRSAVCVEAGGGERQRQRGFLATVRVDDVQAPADGALDRLGRRRTEGRAVADCAGGGLPAALGRARRRTAVIEARAAGVPVVAMWCGVLPERVVHGVTGWLAHGDGGGTRTWSRFSWRKRLAPVEIGIRLGMPPSTVLNRLSHLDRVTGEPIRRYEHPHPGSMLHVMPSPFLADRLKALRTEAGWSQAELAEKIDSDGRQVSRYENGRITPSLEALVRIAETFNVSVDYLVIPDADRRPLHSPQHALADKLADLATLDDDDQAAMLKILDALVTRPNSAPSPAAPASNRAGLLSPSGPDQLVYPCNRRCAGPVTNDFWIIRCPAPERRPSSDAPASTSGSRCSRSTADSSSRRVASSMSLARSSNASTRPSSSSGTSRVSRVRTWHLFSFGASASPNGSSHNPTLT